MESIIASVSTVVVRDSFYYSAHAVINGRLTTASCGHNHSREDLANKCLSFLHQRWDAIAGSTHNIIEVANICEPIFEVRWMDAIAEGRHREAWSRFCLM